MKHDEKTIDLEKERKLNQAIAQLKTAEATPSDLWPGIAERIASNPSAGKSAKKNAETKLFASRWHNWAIAASLVLCVGSLTYSWHQVDKANAVYAQASEIQAKLEAELQQNGQAQTQSGEVSIESQGLSNPRIASVSFQTNDSSEVDASYYRRQVDQMEKEFKAAKASLMARISMNRANIDEALLRQIETELMEIERASLVLKKAMGQQFDANFTNLLRVTYQQELTVLSQLAKLDNTI